jgi:formamidopyrimidine-DNA glycosylase
MPELPEVETIRRELEPLVSGETFALPILHMPTTIAYPDAELFIARLTGRKVLKVTRRGKYLFLELDRGILAIHLRMTGNIIYSNTKGPVEDRFLRLTFPFHDGSALFFSDMRRFGRVWLVKDQNELETIVLKNTGPDILNDLNREQFIKLLAGRERSRLKALLLDQAFAAGMGNIYTDECLFRCGLHPLRRASTLSRSEAAELYDAMQTVLAEGIAHGGTTFRDYRNARGALGDFQSRLAVYGRKGESCRCGAEIVKTVVAGRGTYLCPCCQEEWEEQEGET